MGKLRKAAASMICIAEVLFIIGSMAACAGKDNGTLPQQQTDVLDETRQSIEQPNEMPQETVQQNETQQSIEQSNETPQETVQQNETRQAAAQPDMAQQSTNQPAPNGNGQISLDDAKNAALTDAGLSSADVGYTKEKLDYEDGIAVYEIDFYAGNTEYEYEINAATGEVYSKGVDTHYNGTEHGHNGHNEHAGTTDRYIGADSAESIALSHAGFSETEVSRLKSEFDIDDGIAVYEVEFDKDGREYEYTINATDGSIIEYDID